MSVVARQPDPDNPFVYVQPDAPINHGNRGGPLEQFIFLAFELD